MNDIDASLEEAHSGNTESWNNFKDFLDSIEAEDEKEAFLYTSKIKASEIFSKYL